jgi:hypothetical protein
MSGRITRASRHRRRATFAVAACVLWLLGVEVLPNLHLATHEADHTHEADGTIVRVSFGGTHSHGGVTHADHDDHDVDQDRDHHDRDSKRRDQLAIDVPAHGAAGLAHRAIALHQPPPPVIAPLPVVRTMLWQEHEPNERLNVAYAARPAARGPPAHG